MTEFFDLHIFLKKLLLGVNSYFTKKFNEPDQSKYDDSMIPFKEEGHWSVKPKEVTITREVLEAAWNKTQNVSGMKVPDHYMNALCEELGL